MADLHYADYIVFSVLLLASGLVGPFYMWRNRKKNATAESYFVGNRSMHIVPIAVSLFASFWSATAMIGIPAELYTGGARYFMSSVGQVIGMFLGAVFVVPMMYNLKLISTYQYLEMRFNSKLVRYIGTIAGVIAYIFSIAVTTFAPCVALETVSPIPVWASVSVTASITMLYTTLGGIRAVVAVDFLQALVMFLGILVATIVGYIKLDGNFESAMDLAKNGGRLDFFDFNPDIRNTYSIYAMMLPSILIAAGHHSTSQMAVQRYSALPNVKQAIWSMIALTPQIIIFKILLLFLSLAMYVHYELQGCDPLRGKVISNANQLTTYYVSEILAYPGLIGLWFAALFSGALSTMSTSYNSTSAVVWDGLLKEKYETKLGQRGVSLALKLITLLIGVTSSLMAVVFQWIPGSIIKLSMSTVSIFGGAVFICYFAGALFPFVNATGAICGMVTATVLTGFVAGGQMLFGLGSEEVWLPTTTTNCASFFNLPFLLLEGVESTQSRWNDPANLPAGLMYIFSMSYFLFPLFTSLAGLLIAIFVSLLTGGLKTAGNIERRLLIVKNCFARKNPPKECNEDGETDSLKNAYQFPLPE